MPTPAPPARLALRVELGHAGRGGKREEATMVDAKLVTTVVLSALIMLYGRKGAADFPCHVEDVDFRRNKAIVRVDAARQSELETALAFYVVHQGQVCRVRRWTARDDAHFARIAQDRETLSMDF